MTQRIVHLIPPPTCEASRKVAALLARRLPASEFDIKTLVLEADASRPVCHARGRVDFCAGRRWAFDPQAVFRLRGWLRSMRPELVHTWNFDGLAYVRLALLGTGFAPSIVHELSTADCREALQAPAARWLARTTSCRVTPSRAALAHCRARGWAEGHYCRIARGVEGAQGSRIRREQLYAEFRLPQEAKLILAAGPLVHEMRLKELIWATDQLKAVGCPAHLLVVGDGPLRAALSRYARLNRIDQRVHFLGSRGDVDQWLTHVDVVWHAALDDRHAATMLEAMSVGVPAVAADAPGIRDEMIVHGRGGFLVPPGERAGFARWTLALLEDLEMRDRIASAGRQRALSEFSAEAMVEQYAALYRRHR